MANPDIFDVANAGVACILQSVSDGITLALIDGAIEAYSIEDCLSFSFRPIIPAVNFHFQSTDVPSCVESDMEEPLPPTEQRVEWIRQKEVESRKQDAETQKIEVAFEHPTID
jgi:hypothetical protein